MRAELRVSAEIPPIQSEETGAHRERSLAEVSRVANRAAGAGAGTIWFTGSAGAPTPMLDACTIAAGLSPAIGDALVGAVFELPPSGRHPSLTAREVTALDVVSGGRGALWLRQDAGGGGPEPRREHGARRERAAGQEEVSRWEQFAEAVEVCRAVLEDGSPTFSGRHFHVAAAVNRPPPRQEGGIPIVVEPSVDATWLAEHDGATELLRSYVLGSIDAIVCDLDADEIEAWRTLAREGTSRQEGRDGTARVGVIGRDTLPSVERADADVFERRLDVALGAGADGVVLRFR